jgi:hypothetical protein
MRELEDGTTITTDVRLARRLEVNEEPDYRASQIQANAREEEQREQVRRNIDALANRPRPSTVTTTTTTVVTTTANVIEEPALVEAPTRQATQSTLAPEPQPPSPRFSRSPSPTRESTQAPAPTQASTSTFRTRPLQRDSFATALERARRQLAEAPGTSGPYAEELRLHRYPDELVRFVTRQWETNGDTNSDDESMVSMSNPRRCQQCGKLDTIEHKQDCEERERESLSARFKRTQCSICLEQVGQARPEEIVFTPCGHVLHTRCYNNNRQVGVNPDLCPTCKRHIPQLYQLFHA